MGPTLNVGNLLRLPYGCGEQNMINFAPGIYIMQYLFTVGQLTTSIENKAKNIMTTGNLKPFEWEMVVLMVSALGSGSSGPGLIAGQSHCVVFLGNTLNSYSTSLHPGV